MMNEYCADLQFNFSLLNNTPLSKTRHYLPNKPILNNNLINILVKKNIIISFVEILYSRPFFRSSIHTDGDLGDYIKLNIIRGGKSSAMSWYEINSRQQKPQMINDIGATYVNYDPKDVELVHSSFVSVSLVQVGMPHSVVNCEEERWCVGLVLRDIKTKNRLTMKQAVTLLDEYVVKL
jgi:hypothetical protein